ncbi:MAG TPA: hypothetical protein VFB50_01195, partial [Chloroflexota bacterium]|nr:hypothetical protein [Chloroflexota bacterium]
MTRVVLAKFRHSYLPAVARGTTIIALLAPSLAAPAAPLASASELSEYTTSCSRGSPLCPEVEDSAQVFGHYVGHDEPSLLFYSNEPGSGNSTRYQLRLPEEPPTLPTADGTGGTFNFQLHPALWVGMALCDTESSPNPGTKPCPASSDANIFDGSNPAQPDYIGSHPGTAFVEVQFYPPGWVPWPASQIINGGSSCSATRWCAAIAIFSLQRADNTLTLNNADCLNRTGLESFNFAFITRTGQPQGPPSPLFQTTAGTFTPRAGKTLFMNGGDTITVDLRDSPSGLRVSLLDQDSDESGSMTASAANGFQQVIFDPAATTCRSRPYNFHPMYSTSSEHTRVPWAAHSYNVAFSDEIGHFEYCPHVHSADGTGDLGTFVCDSIPTASDPAGADRDDEDGNCAPASMSTRIQIDGCTGTDGDFDGPAYKRVWPGSTTDVTREHFKDPTPIRFTTPLFNNGTRNYSRIAFEADLPAIEAGQGCSTRTGVHCTNPPAASEFYPI